MAVLQRKFVNPKETPLRFPKQDEDAMLAKLKAAARDVLGGGGDDDDDDDWSDEDDDVMTPLDPIDPFVFFADTLSSLQVRCWAG